MEVIRKDIYKFILRDGEQQVIVNDELLYEVYKNLNMWGTFWEYLTRGICHDTLKARLYCLVVNIRGGLREEFRGWQFWYPSYEEVYAVLNNLFVSGAELPWKLRMSPWTKEENNREEVTVDLQKFWEEQEAPPVFWKLVNELAAE